VETVSGETTVKQLKGSGKVDQSFFSQIIGQPSHYLFRKIIINKKALQGDVEGLKKALENYKRPFLNCSEEKQRGIYLTDWIDEARKRTAKRLTIQLHSPQPPFKRSKKSLEQRKKKHAPKSPLAAKIRRNRLVKALFTGECLKDVAISTGLSPKTAGSQATNILKHPQALKTFIRYMEKEGLTDNFLAAKVHSLINAKKVVYFQKDGIVTDERIVDALETQRKTLELATKLKGHLKDRSEVDVNVGIMAMVVQAVKDEEEQ
jgi:hypothetical protein